MSPTALARHGPHQPAIALVRQRIAIRSRCAQEQSADLRRPTLNLGSIRKRREVSPSKPLRQGPQGSEAAEDLYRSPGGHPRYAKAVEDPRLKITRRGIVRIRIPGWMTNQNTHPRNILVTDAPWEHRAAPAQDRPLSA